MGTTGLPPEIAKSAAEWLSVLTSSAPLGIVVSDGAGRVIFANEAMSRMLGAGEETLTGLELVDIMPARFHERHLARFQQFIAAEGDSHFGSEAELFGLRRDGSEFPIEIWINARMVDGKAYVFARILDLSQRFATEREIVEAKDAYSGLVRNISGAVYRCKNDEDWTVEFISEGSFALLGYSPDELINSRVTTLGALMHPDDVAPVWEKCQANLATQRACSNEYRIRHRDGGEKWIWDQAQGVYSETGELLHIDGLLTDITSQRLAHRAIEESENRFRSLFESASVGVALIDSRNHEFIRVNEAYAEFLGYTSDELIGKNVESITHPDDIAIDLALGERVTRGEIPDYRLDKRYIRKDGQVVWGHLSLAKIAETDDSPELHVAIVKDLTARKEAEAERNELLERLQLIASQVPGVLYQFKMRPDGTSCFPYASEGIREIYRVTPEQVREDATDVFAVLHPDDYDGIVESITKSYETMQPWKYEYRVKFSDGVVRWLYGNSVPQREDDGSILWHGFITDVTERKAVQDSLSASEVRFREIFEQAVDGIFIADATGFFLEANSAGAAMLGYATSEMSGMPIPQILPEREHEHAAQQIARMLEGEIVEDKFEMRRKDGTTFPGEVTAKRLPDGRLQGVVRDVTERNRAEAHRRDLEAQLQHAQKLESMGVLAGGIAHDFNNLLTSILGYSDLALREIPQSSPARSLITHAVNGARQAADLTKQMLAYSGKGRFVIEPINLSSIVEEMTRLLEVSISKTCVLKCSFMPDLPSVEADASQMRQIIMNLVINASEAIGEKSGFIGITTGVMHCDMSYLSATSLDKDLVEGLYVYVEVADTGAGMDATTKSKLFDPFFTTKFTGRGLGMAAVLGIVRGHKGAIKCYSEQGKGTTFKVLFPASDLAPAFHSPPSAGPNYKSSGLVLVVDDEESVRGLAQVMLEEMGFAVLTAADGQDGVDIYRNRHQDIRFVLLDMTMPRLDGEQTFREMRRINGKVKAILSSGYNEQTATSRFTGKGLAAFLQKPYRYAELTGVVQKILGESNTTETPST